MSARPAPNVVVFDCDGVLIDSNRLKISLFRETLERAGFAAPDIERFAAFQAASFGMSRYRLFDALLGWDLSHRPAVARDDLVATYAGLLRDKYVAVLPTPGMQEVVASLEVDCDLYVVSGSDQSELREVLRERGEADPFRMILGSPATKEANLRLVLDDVRRRHGMAEPARIVFVGDAEADFRAAEAHGLRFVYMDAYSTAQQRMRALASIHGFPVIADLRELRAAIEPSLLSEGI